MRGNLRYNMLYMPEESAQTKESSTLKESKEMEPEKELVSWIGPSRPFKRRDRKFYITTISIAGLFALVMFLVEGFLPVILIISIVFLFYVLSTVEPENIEYKVTTKGIEIAGRKTEWRMARRFWFTNRFGSTLLVVETVAFPGRLEVVIPANQKEEIMKALGDYLTHEEAPPSSLDKAANWFAKRMPS